MIDEGGGARFEKVQNREAKSLSRATVRHVVPGSIVHTDEWEGLLHRAIRMRRLTIVRV